MSEASRKREIFGWCMYDWANSAYMLTVVTAVLPAYFNTVIVPEEGWKVLGLTVSAPALWGFMVSFAAIIMFAAAPVLGAIADHSGRTRRFLAVFCYTGAAAALGLAFAGPGDVWWTVLLFIIAQSGFVGANVFYDSFLPRIAPEGRMDWLSGRGFAFGYIGGGVQFLLALAIIALHEQLGLGKDTAARIAIGMAAVWWAGFSLVTVRLVREHRPESGAIEKKTLAGYAAFGIGRVLRTTAKVRTMPQVGLFLLAYLLYNDGIQTVITLATIYGSDELGLSMTVLMVTLLVIQFVAFFGAIVFSRLAERFSARRMLLGAVTAWAAIVVYAYFMEGAKEYFVLGVFVGLVMGGSQALSRSLFASMIPAAESALFFGYFSVVQKLSAIGGPFLFAMVRQATGSSRSAILPVALFFVAGGLILWRVRPEQAIGARQDALDTD